MSCFNHHEEAIEEYNRVTLQERKDMVRVNEVALHNLLDSKKTYSRLIGACLLMAMMTLAAGIDRSDYSYSVTFISIFTLVIIYSTFRIRALNGFIATLSTSDADKE